MFCSTCGAQLPPKGRFCSSCGAPAGPSTSAPPDFLPTALGHEEDYGGETLASGTPPPIARTPIRPPSTPSIHSTPRHAATNRTLSSSSGSISGGRFAPGQIVAERYRIVALAGRGGMGEVYRAEDLRLSQLVAIKFLPSSLSEDAASLARFHSEVRIARQVSHPNVCRVFDIGDADGTPFLTMEYIDGEDLASVVRRIGRLSPDKATEIARQICAGMAAAHERGVIHRDMKPANVMLDGAGKIRITDFGLAGLAATIQGAEVRAGTPAYMAPEQLAGKEVTVKSDIYSLGLILYEILTGQRAFDAKTLPELMKLREEEAISNPTTFVRDLDPLIERVVLRCLEKEPANRPNSALQVAAALPGGDPLAAALAAGETPSPAMVAAAGKTEGMRPKLALALFSTVVLGLIAYMFIADRFKISNLTPLEKPPEVLAARAQEILRQFGYSNPPADTAYGIFGDNNYTNYISEKDKSQTRWLRLRNTRPAPILFWYRTSPRLMEPMRFFSSDGSGVVTTADPPMELSGMTTLMLDMEGRLVYFEAIAPQKEEAPAVTPVVDWSPLFASAGLDLNAFHPTPPAWAALLPTDNRSAWTGAVPEQPDISLRIEAASFHGKPVYFDSLHPWDWDHPPRDVVRSRSTHQQLAVILLVTLFSAIIVASMFVVRRHHRLNRGDARGSLRLSNFILLTFVAMWLLRAHHLPSIDEFDLAIFALAWGFLVSSLARLLYFALEPFVRKRDPHTIISWSRLIGGNLRDPLVGRDILIGVVYGVLLTIFESLDNFLLPALGKLPPEPGFVAGETLVSLRNSLGLAMHYTWIFVLYTLLIFFLFFLLRLVVKKDWLAGTVIVFIGAITNSGGDYAWVTFTASAVIWLSIYLVLRRFGLVALVTGLVVQNILVVSPVTTHWSRWYAANAIVGMAVIVALALYGFYIALAGQEIFPGALD